MNKNTVEKNTGVDYKRKNHNPCPYNIKSVIEAMGEGGNTPFYHKMTDFFQGKVNRPTTEMLENFQKECNEQHKAFQAFMKEAIRKSKAADKAKS